MVFAIDGTKVSFTAGGYIKLYGRRLAMMFSIMAIWQCCANGTRINGACPRSLPALGC